MKRLLIVLLFLLAQKLVAQTAAEIRLGKAIMKAYNQKEYATVYGMFSGEFKRTTTADNIAGFLEYNIYDRLGRMKRITYVRQDKGAAVFWVTFKGGKLEMTLAVDSTEKISGLKFTPIFKEQTVKVRQGTPLLSNNPLASTRDRLVDSLVKQFAANTSMVGCAVGVISGGSSAVYGYGERVKNAKKTPDQNTIFEIGSVTKTFTALLLAEAVAQKRISADADIRPYLKDVYPNLVNDGEPIRFCHLVNHTSGLPRLPADLDEQPSFDEKDPYKHYSREMILAFLHKVKLVHKPGTHNEYSNYGVALLGLLLEQVFAKPYHELLVQYVYTPLGMRHTFASIPDSLRSNMVEVYDKTGRFVLNVWDLGDITPAGGLKSTPADMVAYLKGQLANTTDAIRLGHTETFMENPGRGVAYGWMIFTLANGDHLYWHNGATGGSTSFCAFIPERDVAVVVLNNSANSVDELGMLLVAGLK